MRTRSLILHALLCLLLVAMVSHVAIANWSIAPKRGGYRLGQAASNDYRSTFFKANPELEGKVVVHHGIEQQALKRYPGRFTEAEIHSLENLRGIPKAANPDLHLSQIRREWNAFYRQYPNATREQILQKAADIDSTLGSGFIPPVGG